MELTRVSCVLVVLCSCVLLACGSFLKDWSVVEEAKGNEKITFYVALHQRNVDQLEKLLYSVSDPKSSEYGREVPQEEVADLIYPSKVEHDRVVNFLTRNSPSMIVTSYGDSLRVTATASEVAAIFNAKFHWYLHGPSGHHALRAPQITIPAEIKQDVHMITNLVAFPIIMKKHKTLEDLADPSIVTDTEMGYFAPSTLRRLYNVPATARATNAQSSQCALEFAPEGTFSFTDLAVFAKLADEEPFNYTHIVGPFTSGAWGNTESELDVQLLGAIGAGAENWFWTITDGWIYEMAVQIYNNATKPNIFSISYGWPEVLTCGSAAVQAHCTNNDNLDYITRANAELAKLGTARITVIACSQDEGAPSSANMVCMNKTHPIFGIYPGSSPFATTVSATAAIVDKTGQHTFPPASVYPPICYLYPCSNSSLEQPAMPNTTLYQWTTGGGFSEYVVAPSYQKAAIQSYFATDSIKPPTNYTWPNNRGYPDISAIGARTLIAINGATTPVEGTSASTPIIAGLATLLNDARFNAGKTALGFLNPVLYAMATEVPTAFNDITEGNNRCTEGSFCCEYGYYAGDGWDPVTGLGSPNFGEMLKYIQTLP